MSIRGLAVELFSERLSIYLRGNRFSYELAALQPKFMSLAELVGRCLIQPRPGGAAFHERPESSSAEWQGLTLPFPRA